jgi:AcrR family transcriptional regulator
MAWDTAGTKRKILDAATREFAQRGPDGTTIERIAKLAGVNKERVYNYFDSKTALFARVLREQLATAAQDLPLDATNPDGIAEYAGRLYDYHREHPELARLLQWEALTFEAEVPEEDQRREYYGHKTAALADGQAAGTISSTVAPDLLHFLLLSLAAYWAVLPQVARMITVDSADAEAEYDRQRAAVVEAAHRLVSVTGPAAVGGEDFATGRLEARR